jgi:hypothetical protein
MTRVFAFVLAIIAACAALPGRADAQPRNVPREASRDLPIAAFAGRFTGSGIAAGEDADYIGVTQRDLDVTIEAQGTSFRASWTTVLRQGGTPGNPNVRRRSNALTFAPARGGIFRATESGDVIAGQPIWWARIRGTTLYIYELNVLDDGRWDVQTYARTVSGAGMQLRYTRLVDGERLRVVQGRLVKQQN